MADLTTESLHSAKGFLWRNLFDLRRPVLVTLKTKTDRRKKEWTVHMNFCWESLCQCGIWNAVSKSWLWLRPQFNERNVDRLHHQSVMTGNPRQKPQKDIISLLLHRAKVSPQLVRWVSNVFTFPIFRWVEAENFVCMLKSSTHRKRFATLVNSCGNVAKQRMLSNFQDNTNTLVHNLVHTES